MTGSHSVFRTTVPLLAALAAGAAPWAQANDGKVKDFGLITAGSGGFGGVLAPGDRFGDSTTSIGDLDENGITDIAVGAPGSDDGGANRGAVWILFLDAAGTVIGEQKISSTSGGFGGVLANADQFGTSVDDAGDLDGDGRHELVVGTEGEKLFVLGLNGDGTVASSQAIAAGMGGFGGTLVAGDRFGAAVGSLGDVDGDEIPDLAVGAPGDDNGGTNRGAVWVLFLNSDGTVAAEQKISSTLGGFGVGLANSDAFGSSVEGIEDLDGDQVPELVVGAPLTNGLDQISPGPGAPPVPTPVADEGVVYVLFLNTDGTVASKVEIGEDQSGFGGRPLQNAQFGAELGVLGDIDGNGVRDISIGVRNHASPIGAIGAIYEVFLAADGTVVSERLVTDKQAGFNGGFQVFLVFPGDAFHAPAYLRDIDDDCLGDIVVGAPGADFAGTDTGAVWVLLLLGQGQATTVSRNGTGANAVAYTSTSDPRINRTWTSEVDVSGHPGATVSVIFGMNQPDLAASGFGEILVLLSGETQFIDVQIPVGDLATHALFIPNDLALIGYEVFSQALIGGGGLELVNAVDLKLGF